MPFISVTPLQKTVPHVRLRFAGNVWFSSCMHTRISKAQRNLAAERTAAGRQRDSVHSSFFYKSNIVRIDQWNQRKRGSQSELLIGTAPRVMFDADNVCHVLCWCCKGWLTSMRILWNLKTCNNENVISIALLFDSHHYSSCSPYYATLNLTSVNKKSKQNQAKPSRNQAETARVACTPKPLVMPSSIGIPHTSTALPTSSCPRSSSVKLRRLRNT